MADKLVTIAQFTDYIEAEMAKQLLADYKIESVVTGENASNIYSGVPSFGGYCKLQTLETRRNKRGKSWNLLKKRYLRWLIIV